MTGSPVNTPTTLYELSSWFRSVAYSGSSYSTMDTKAAAFETQNGESIIAYYNQSCRTEYLNQESLTVYGNVFGFPQSNMCVNFIYDLNGSKGPNTVGKDIGIMTVFNATDSNVVAPMPASATNTEATTWYNAAKLCTSKDAESRLPNIDELSAFLININIMNIPTSIDTIWSSSVYNTDRAWLLRPNDGHIGSDYKANSFPTVV